MQLVEGKDYYIENGKYVFTSHYLKTKGYCCGSGCRHCPYPKDECSDICVEIINKTTFPEHLKLK